MIKLLLMAIMSVESGGDPGAIGDNGDSIGAFQIQYAYWVDSGVPGKYEDCFKPEYAEKVVLAYWDRYAKDWSPEELILLHNCGPNWRNKPNYKYLAKVLTAAYE